MAASTTKRKKLANTTAQPYAKEQQALQAIAEFFDNHEPQEAEDRLWQWLVEALSREHSIYNNAKERANLIFFYENVKKLVHSFSVIHEHIMNVRA
ncbi:MAG: hypothetical protein J7621_19105 [Niastella sp.]|nr:hypothetical protein [Niastella sp.]PZQ97387.1 MAG: hypothetical protein DI539_29830 [Flavobacterium psychrophilum]